MKRNHFGLIAPLCLAMAAATGCKKEEPPPPLPAPQAVTAAPAPLQLRPEDAGIKLPSADAGGKKVVHGGGGGGGGGGLGPCCQALIQNSASQPEPQKTYMLQAGQMCKVFLAQGMGKQVVGQLMGLLRGASMPAACH
jgi:hypothetical protein